MTVQIAQKTRSGALKVRSEKFSGFNCLYYVYLLVEVTQDHRTGNDQL